MHTDTYRVGTGIWYNQRNITLKSLSDANIINSQTHVLIDSVVLDRDTLHAKNGFCLVHNSKKCLHIVRTSHAHCDI